MSQRKKILHLIDHLGAGGAQVIIGNLVKGITEIDQEVVYFFNEDKNKEHIEKGGAKIIPFNYGKYGYGNVIIKLLNPLSFINLALFLNKSRADIIHVHLFYSFFATIPLRIIFPRKKIIYTMHAMRNQVPWFYFVLGLFGWVCNYYIADLEEAKKDILDAGIKESKIGAINISTDYYLGDYCGQDVIREFDLSGKYVILNVARLHKQKGHELLIRAFKKASENNDTMRLLIVGDGEERRVIEKTIYDLGLNGKVILAGYRPDRKSFYDACDVYVNSSISEAGGVAIIEAMAREKPVIAFEIGAINSLVKNGLNGFLVKAGDIDALASIIKKCFHEPGLISSLGKNACDFVKNNFSLDGLIENYKNLYEKILINKKI